MVKARKQGVRRWTNVEDNGVSFKYTLSYRSSVPTAGGGAAAAAGWVPTVAAAARAAGAGAGAGAAGG